MAIFTCQNCKKELEIEQRIYDKTYKNHTFCLDCRSAHGGKRTGAGRPSLGTTKKVSITLPNETWEQLNNAKGDKSMSAMLREIIIDGNWI